MAEMLLWSRPPSGSGCEAVKLFRVDEDSQEVLSLLPPAPNSNGQADHFSLSESGVRSGSSHLLATKRVQ